MEQLKDNFEFKAPEDLKIIVKQYPSELKELIRIHNDYFKMKLLEDKAKGKRNKVQDSNKYEFLDYDKELNRNINETLINQFPEKIRKRLSLFLNSLFGILVLPF